jgi:hypothetical protein
MNGLMRKSVNVIAVVNLAKKENVKIALVKIVNAMVVVANSVLI